MIMSNPNGSYEYIYRSMWHDISQRLAAMIKDPVNMVSRFFAGRLERKRLKVTEIINIITQSIDTIKNLKINHTVRPPRYFF